MLVLSMLVGLELPGLHQRCFALGLAEANGRLPKAPRSDAQRGLRQHNSTGAPVPLADLVGSAFRAPRRMRPS